jgi:hypothetical protein
MCFSFQAVFFSLWVFIARSVLTLSPHIFNKVYWVRIQTDWLDTLEKLVNKLASQLLADEVSSDCTEAGIPGKTTVKKGLPSAAVFGKPIFLLCPC